MFRPFRKLLIKMRDYLRTLNKNELFQLEKLLCTNEEISITQNQNAVADENTGQCCDDKSKQQQTQQTTQAQQVTTNVTIVPNNETSTINKSNENFYSIKDNAKTDDWVSEEAEGADDEAEEDDNSNYENLVTADCATGYLVPNTTLGNLLQSNAAPLTYNIVISEQDDENAIANDDEQSPANVATKRDSGMGTGENGSLDHSPEQEQNTNTNVLTGQYDENWENLRKIVEPTSSKSGHSSSHHHRHKERSSKRKSRKHQSSSSDDTSSSASSSSVSSPTSTSSGTGSESRDISRRAKFKYVQLHH